MVYSTRNRMTGTSGIDVEGMVASMMKAEQMKMDRLTSKRALASWKQESYLNVKSSIRDFDKKYLDNLNATSMRSSAAFKKYDFSVKASDQTSSAISVSSTSDTKSGSVKVEVYQMATNETYSTTEIGDRFYTKSMDNFDFTKIKVGDSFNISVDGKAQTIAFTQADIDAINTPDTASPIDGSKEKALAKILHTKLAVFGEESVYNSEDKKVVTVQKIQAVYNEETKSITFGSGIGHTINIYADPKNADSKILDELGIKSNPPIGLDKTEKMIEAFPSISKGDNTITLNGRKISFSSEDTVDDFMQKINSAAANVKMSFDANTKSYKLKSEKTGTANSINMDDKAKALFSAMGFNKFTQGADALYRIDDGALLRNESNTVDASSLKLTFNAVTEVGKPVNITSSVNSSSAKESILKFIEGYNELYAALKSEVDTSRTKKNDYDYYGPLTDEQKKAMSDKQVEDWEKSGKKGLLNRDTILNDMLTEMRAMMNKSVDLGGGAKISLYDIGIQTTANWKEAGKLVVDEEKLGKALNERLDDVITLFTKPAEYTRLDKANYRNRLDSEGISERLSDINNYFAGPSGKITLYAGLNASDQSSNMYKEIFAMDKVIKQKTRDLARKEDHYYSMLARMEKSINESNAQMASLQNFGG